MCSQHKILFLNGKSTRQTLYSKKINSCIVLCYNITKPVSVHSECYARAPEEKTPDAILDADLPENQPKY